MAKAQDVMTRPFPLRCLRTRTDCRPLSQVISDDDSTFVCVGLLNEPNENDEYRHCFKSDKTDTVFDCNETDMLDTIETMSCAMSMKRRLEDSNDE